MKGKAGAREQEQSGGALELARRSPLPGNRPIVTTNRDANMDEFVGYMD